MPKRVCQKMLLGCPELCTSVGSPVCQYGCSLGSRTICQQSTGCHRAPSTELVSAPGPASCPLPVSAPWLLLIGPCGGVDAPHPHSWDTASPPCTHANCPQLYRGLRLLLLWQLTCMQMLMEFMLLLAHGLLSDARLTAFQCDSWHLRPESHLFPHDGRQ